MLGAPSRRSNVAGIAVEFRGREQTHALRGLQIAVVALENQEPLDWRATVDEPTPGVRLRRAGDEKPKIRIAGDRPESRDGRRRIERHIGRRCAKHAVEADDALERLLEVDSDPVSALHSLVTEKLSKAIRVGVERRVSRLPSAIDNGDSCRISLGRGCEPCVEDCGAHGIRNFPAVAAAEAHGPVLVRGRATDWTTQKPTSTIGPDALVPHTFAILPTPSTRCTPRSALLSSPECGSAAGAGRLQTSSGAHRRGSGGDGARDSAAGRKSVAVVIPFRRGYNATT